MPFYADSDQFYACAQVLFDRLQANYPQASQAVRDARLLIRFQCSDPVVELTINGRRDPVAIDYGAMRIRPELDVQMTVDTLHQILLGELTLPKALSSKAMRVKGPVWKTLSLAELFNQSQLLYPQVLREQNLLK